MELVTHFHRRILLPLVWSTGSNCRGLIIGEKMPSTIHKVLNFLSIPIKIGNLNRAIYMGDVYLQVLPGLIILALIERYFDKV